MAYGWDDVVAFGLTLAGAELSTHYGGPALKVGGRAFAATGREPERSFALLMPIEQVELALEVEPALFYQTPHYVGWAAVLVRYAADFATVSDWIARAHAAQTTRPKPRRR